VVVFTGERTGSAGSRDAARYQHPAFPFVSPYFIESQGYHFPHIYSPTLVCNFYFYFILSRGTGISMDWSSGTGSVGVRTGYERPLFPDNRTFLFCLHRLVHEGCAVLVHATRHELFPSGMAAEYSWLFFPPCLVLAGKRAAGLLRLRSSKRVVEKTN